MIKNLTGLLALVAMFAPGLAHAGFGATAHLGGLSDGTGFSPTLDWRAKGFLVQVNLIDTIGSITDDQLDVGAAFSGVAAKRKIADQIEGVMMPGGRVSYYGLIGDLADAADKAKVQAGGFSLAGEFRLGMEMKDKMGFGVYVVPQIGVSNRLGVGTVADDEGEIGLTYGGGLEVSAWFLEN